MKYREERPRKKSVTRKRNRKETVTKNMRYLTMHQDKVNLSPISISKKNRNRGQPFQDLVSMWPKIVEYIGLSEYESKVYLSLISLGTAGARKLSLNCDVPRTKVYGTLKKLIDYGLVNEIPGAPKQFSPASPEECFNTLLSLTKEKTLDFDIIIQKLEKTHEKHKEQQGPRKKIIWYLNSADDIKGKCNEIIRQSEDELIIITNADGLGTLFNAAHKLLDEVQEKGVAIKLYSPLDPKTNPLARELSYIFQVKKIEINTPILFINSDQKRFLLSRLTERGSENPFEAAMFSNDTQLLTLICLLMVNSKEKTLLNMLKQNMM